MEQELDKRERILRATAELIVKNGLQSPMSAIAAKADVSMGTIYNYFTSKDQLILGVYAQLAEQFNDLVVEEEIDRSLPHRDRIMVYINNYIDFFWADWDRAILFEYLSSVPLVSAEELAGVFAKTRAYSRTLLEEAQTAGAVKPFSVSFMGGLIGGAIRNTLKWHRMAHTTLSPEERSQIGEMCWSAIANSPDVSEVAPSRP